MSDHKRPCDWPSSFICTVVRLLSGIIIPPDPETREGLCYLAARLLSPDTIVNSFLPRGLDKSTGIEEKYRYAYNTENEMADKYENIYYCYGHRVTAKWKTRSPCYGYINLQPCVCRSC